jgi:abortive infection bacteriophage resistance protein
MKFEKPALTFLEQAQLLHRRGMIGDTERMVRRLSAVNYYRLSGYWHHRKRPGDPDEAFHPGTHFDVVWEQYVFDRKLRLLVMDAIERIEVALRTQFSYHHSHAHGAFGYFEDPQSMPKLSDRDEFFETIDREVKRSRRETFVKHFETKYGDSHRLPPLWVATEVLSFGSVLRLFQNSSNRVKSAVAQTFGVSHEVLRTWLWSLNEVRNIAAHHGRLWNKTLGNRPMIPSIRFHPAWHQPPFDDDRLYAVLSICAHCLPRVAPHSRWRARVFELLQENPRIPIRNMGFPNDWQSSALWQTPAG